MIGGAELLPLQFASLEAVEGGTLVRFTDWRKQEVPRYGLGQLPEPGETWRGHGPEPAMSAVSVPFPCAVFCATPDALIKAVDRARKAYDSAKDPYPGMAGIA